MKNMIRITLCVSFFLLIFSESSYSIPAFARKYNMNCQTCHSPIPKLKPYGAQFAADGFVLADKDAPRYFVDTGDPLLSLIRDLPIALRLEGYITYNNENQSQGDFAAPYLLKFLSGGSIASDISYYFYFFFSEAGEVAGIEDAFLMFNDLIDGQDLDLYVGQFQLSDPLFKRELRLTFEDYKIYSTKVGNSNCDFTYDRGLMLTYGAPTNTDIVLEVLNGTGIGARNGFGNFDNDKYKNLIARVSQEINENIRIGFVGYFGKEKLTDDFSNEFTNQFTSYGPDLTLSYNDQLELNVQYLQRKDDRPTIFNIDVETKGAFAELVYTPLGDESRWYGVGLFNFVDSQFNDLDYRSATLHIGHLLKRNLRLTAEATYDLDRKFTKISAGFVTAF